MSSHLKSHGFIGLDETEQVQINHGCCGEEPTSVLYYKNDSNGEELLRTILQDMKLEHVFSFALVALNT